MGQVSSYLTSREKSPVKPSTVFYILRVREVDPEKERSIDRISLSTCFSILIPTSGDVTICHFIVFVVFTGGYCLTDLFWYP